MSLLSHFSSVPERCELQLHSAKMKSQEANMSKLADEIEQECKSSLGPYGARGLFYDHWREIVATLRAAEQPSRDEGVLGKHSGTTNRREWWSGGTWLYPGDAVIERSALNPQPAKPVATQIEGTHEQTHERSFPPAQAEPSSGRPAAPAAAPSATPRTDYVDSFATAEPAAVQQHPLVAAVLEWHTYYTHPDATREDMADATQLLYHACENYFSGQIEPAATPLKKAN